MSLPGPEHDSSFDWLLKPIVNSMLLADLVRSWIAGLLDCCIEGSEERSESLPQTQTDAPGGPSFVGYSA